MKTTGSETGRVQEPISGGLRNGFCRLQTLFVPGLWAGGGGGGVKTFV